MKGSRKRALAIVIVMGVMGLYFLHYYFSQIREEVVLQQPRLSGDRSIEECLVNLRETRDFIDEPLSFNDLSQILWAAQGITDPVLKFRAVPSAGALYPLELYVVVGGKGVDGLEEGVYHYLPEKHLLIRTSREDMRPELTSLLALDEDKGFVEKAPVNIVVTAIYERTTEKYSERGVRYVHLEVGCVAQNIYLQATALDLGATIIVSFDEDSVQTLLDAPNPLLIMSVGKPADQNPLSDRHPAEALTHDDLIKLPSPNSIGGTSLEEAIVTRRSIREYGPGNLTLSQLSQILFAARSVISIHEDYPIEIYLTAGEVSDASEGAYHFIQDKHSLNSILEGDAREKLYLASPDNDWLLQGRVVIVIAALYGRSSIELEKRERVVLFEAGMVSQNINLQVAALMLGTVTCGAFSDNLVLEALNLPNSYTPLLLMPIGPRIYEK